MPYGRGQMLGAGVQPGMFTQDYSGFARAGETQGQAMANLGQQLGSAIQTAASVYADNKKITSQANAQAKAGEEYLKAAGTIYKDNPEISGYIENMLAVSNNPSVSPVDRAAMLSQAAQGIKSFSDLSMQSMMLDLRKQQEARLSAGAAQGTAFPNPVDGRVYQPQ